MHTISVDYLEAQARHANWFARQNPGLREELDRVNAEIHARGRTDNFYSSLAESLARYGSLTERQNAALKRSLTQYHDRQAQFAANRPKVTAPMPEGRVTITGTVVSTKWVENDFGGSLKMLVQSDAGWRIFGTVPRSLADTESDLRKGDRVTFTATVTRKEADFGFFSRPTNAQLLNGVAATATNGPSVTYADLHKPEAPVAAPVPAPVAPAPVAPVAGVARPFLAQLAQR